MILCSRGRLSPLQYPYFSCRHGKAACRTTNTKLTPDNGEPPDYPSGVARQRARITATTHTRGRTPPARGICSSLPRLFPPPEFVDQLLLPLVLHLLLWLLPPKAPVIGVLPHLLLPTLVF